MIKKTPRPQKLKNFQFRMRYITNNYAFKKMTDGNVLFCSFHVNFNNIFKRQRMISDEAG